MRTKRRWTACQWPRAFHGARLDSSGDSASGRGFLLRNERLIGGSVHQVRNLGGTGELNLNKPTSPMRIGVDSFRSIRERGVRLADFSRYWGINFTDSL